MSLLDAAVLTFVLTAIARLLLGEATSGRWTRTKRVMDVALAVLIVPFAAKVVSVIGPIVLDAIR